ncbi:cell redox homeostasis [Mactra antiquata]
MLALKGEMRMESFVVCLLGLVVGLCSGHNINFEKSHFIEMKGQTGLTHFIQSNQVRMIFYYKRDTRMTTFFLQELEKTSDFLDMYGVKIGFCDCSHDVNKDVTDCKKENIDKSVHTYKAGNPLLSLELQTMFDVNSIMSNILQLVMLREVPILQTLQEVEKYLKSMKGKKDVVFGHMKAIGTSDHRVFMEVAYAYSSSLQFVVCTDVAATKLFQNAPVQGNDKSTVWWIWTKQMGKEENSYHNIIYKDEFTLKALAKFASVITKPRMVDVAAEGTIQTYTDMDVPIVRFYYNTESRDDMYQKADSLTRYYGGSVIALMIDCDNKELKFMGLCRDGAPAFSLKRGEEKVETFLENIDTDSIATFMDNEFGENNVYYNDDRTNDEDDILQEDAESHPEYIENDEETFDSNIEAVERQDDKVAEFVERTKKIAMKLDLVPALTDKTFPKILEESSTAVVLLYFPFDAVSMGNLRMFGEAAEKLGKETSLKIARVNCFDWTDVCQKEHINIYPTFRVYKDGKQVWDYRGPQDTDAMYSTMKLLELSSPLYETNSDDLLNYITKNEETSLTGVTNTTVVGLFRRGDQKEMEVFKTFAEGYRDRIMFVYSDIDDCSVIAKRFSTKLPAVILSKYDDTIQPHVTFHQKYTIQYLEQFVNENKLPKLTVLTPLMLPEVRRQYNELVILFTDGTDTCKQSEDNLREMVKSQKFNNISFNMMPVPDESSVGYRVLNQYTASSSLPYLSLVNFPKGEVFNFGEVTDLSSLSSWLSNVVKGSSQPSTKLKHGEWKPLNKGFEFLKIIEWENMKAKKKSMKKTDVETKNAVDDPPSDNMDIPSDSTFVEDIDDSDTRRDLFELNKSRLYHQSPGRTSHHGNQEKMKNEEKPSGNENKIKKDKMVGGERKTHDPSEL